MTRLANRSDSHELFRNYSQNPTQALAAALEPYLGSMSRSSGDSAHTVLKHGHPALKDRVRWVAHTGVDVAIFRPSELACAVGRVCEVVGTCLVQRDGSRSVNGIWLLGAVQSDRLEFWRPVCPSAWSSILTSVRDSLRHTSQMT